MNESVLNIGSYLGLAAAEALQSDGLAAPVTDNSEFAMLLSKYIGAGTAVLSGEGIQEDGLKDVQEDGLKGQEDGLKGILANIPGTLQQQAQVQGEQISQNGTSPPIPINEFPLRNLQGLDEEVIRPITLTGPQVPVNAVLPTDNNSANVSLPQGNVGTSVELNLNTGNSLFPLIPVGAPINQSSGLQGLTQSDTLAPGDSISSLANGPPASLLASSNDAANGNQPGKTFASQQDFQLPANQELLMEKNIEISSSAARLTVVKETQATLGSGNTILEKAVEPNAANMANARSINVYAADNSPGQPVIRVYGNQTEPAAQPKLFNLTEKLVDQVVQRLSLVKLNERSEIRINLQPQSLGDLKIKVSFENGVLSAKLMTASYAVKESLETGLNQLRQNLNAQGFDVQNLSVSVNDNRHSEHGHMHGRQNRFLKEQDDGLDIFKNVSEADENAEHEYAVNWLV